MRASSTLYLHVINVSWHFKWFLLEVQFPRDLGILNREKYSTTAAAAAAAAAAATTTTTGWRHYFTLMMKVTRVMSIRM